MDRIVRIFQFPLRQPLQRHRQIRQIELGADLGALRPAAHIAGHGAVTQRQRQRIQENGLAGARFTGDDGQPWCERHLKGAHQGEVANGELREHAVRLSWVKRANAC